MFRKKFPPQIPEDWQSIFDRLLDQMPYRSRRIEILPDRDDPYRGLREIVEPAGADSTVVESYFSALKMQMEKAATEKDLPTDSRANRIAAVLFHLRSWVTPQHFPQHQSLRDMVMFVEGLTKEPWTVDQPRFMVNALVYLRVLLQPKSVTFWQDKVYLPWAGGGYAALIMLVHMEYWKISTTLVAAFEQRCAEEGVEKAQDLLCSTIEDTRVVWPLGVHPERIFGRLYGAAPWSQAVFSEYFPNADDWNRDL